VTVEGKDRGAGAGVPMAPDQVDELPRHRPAVAARLPHDQAHRSLGGGRIDDLAERATTPDLGHPMPAVARQQGHRVGDDELLHQLRPPLGSDQSKAAPVMDQQLAPLDAKLLQAALEKGRQAVHRVVEPGGVRPFRAPPARHVDRHCRTAAFHERHPFLAMGRVAVAVDRRRPLPGDPPVEGLDAVDLHRSLFDPGHGQTLWLAPA